jgi:hypothetical protein
MHYGEDKWWTLLQATVAIGVEVSISRRLMTCPVPKSSRFVDRFSLPPHVLRSGYSSQGACCLIRLYFLPRCESFQLREHLWLSLFANLFYELLILSREILT